jgi:hypothetical protein
MKRRAVRPRAAARSATDVCRRLAELPEAQGSPCRQKLGEPRFPANSVDAKARLLSASNMRRSRIGSAGGQLGMAGQRERHCPANPSLRQVQPNRRHVLPRADFAFDANRDRYTCPAGKELVHFRRTYAIPGSGVIVGGRTLYRAGKLDCDVCELKARCCPNAVARMIPRNLREEAPRGTCARRTFAIRGDLSPPEESRDAYLPTSS